MELCDAEEKKILRPCTSVALFLYLALKMASMDIRWLAYSNVDN